MSAIESMLPKKQTLLRSTSLVSVMTLISRVMGFARDMVIAQLFGAEAGMDAFYVAFRIPNFMRRLFAEGAFSQAFVPVLAEYQRQKSFNEVRLFIARIAGQLGTAVSLVTLLGVIAAPFVIYIFAPGFGEGSTRSILAIDMLRLTFPFLLLVSLTAFAGAVLNTYGYFGVPAITPVLLNLSMIGAALYLCPQFEHPVVGLAWGVLIAGILQLLFQLPFLYQKRLLVKPKLYWKDEGVKRVIKLMVPALFGVSIAQLNLMVDSIFASFLKVGSVTWLYYTDRLNDFPLGVFGVAIATVILPHLSRHHAEQSHEKYSQALDWGIRFILLLGVPSAIGLTFFSMPLIASCFAYGKFTVYDLLQTQRSLIALSLGVPAFMLIKVLASGFYARQDIKTPVKIGALAMVINSLLCFIFIWSLAHAGLAFASAMAGYVNASILLYLLIRRQYFTPTPGWLKFTIQLLLANTALAIFLWFNKGSVDFWLSQKALGRLYYLMTDVILAVIIYLGCLWAVGVRLALFRGKIRG